MSIMVSARQSAGVHWSWAGAGRKILDVLYALLWVVFIVVCLRVTANLGHGPLVRRVEVTGAFRYLRPQEVAARLTEVSRGPLLAVDLAHVRAVALTSPWVEQAKVSLVWPDRVQVSLIEREPVARWGASGYLSTHAEVFVPTAVPDIPGLPWLNGPAGYAPYVMQQYLAMRAVLWPVHLQIVSMQLTDRMSWVVTLDSGVSLKVDNQDPLAKLRRFGVLYQRELEGQMDRVISVDLRYHNGVAVAWKPESTHRQIVNH